MATLEAPVRPARPNLHSGPFVSEPFFDFRNEENARRMRAAIAKVRGHLGHEYDLIIGGKRVKTTDKIKSLNPAKPSEIVHPPESGPRARRARHERRPEGV